MKKMNVALFVIMFMLVSGNCYGQALGSRLSQTSVIIYNNSDKDLKINLGLNVDDLVTYTIKSQEKWVSPTFPLNSRPLVFIKTKSKEVKYSLRLNRTYIIVWNNEKQKWDLKGVKK